MSPLNMEFIDRTAKEVPNRREWRWHEQMRKKVSEQKGRVGELIKKVGMRLSYLSESSLHSIQTRFQTKSLNFASCFYRAIFRNREEILEIQWTPDSAPSFVHRNLWRYVDGGLISKYCNSL